MTGRFPIRARRPILWLLTASLLATPGGAWAQAPPRLDAEWVRKWAEDLEGAKESFPGAHENLFHTLSKNEFESRVDALVTRLPRLSHVEVAVELARIVAMVGDGHTRVTLPLADGVDFRQGHTGTPPARAPGLAFRQLPIRLRTFPDGLRITAIAAEHAAWAGARVTRVGNSSVEYATAAVAEIVHRDNEIGIQRQLPEYMCLAEVLYGAGIAESAERVEWTLVSTSGVQGTLALTPVSPGAEVEWVHARDVSPQASPRWLRSPDDYFWYEHVEEARAVYFQYNRVADKEEVELIDFVQGMLEYIETHEVDRLVIDLRNNDGGDNTLNRAIIHGLIRSTKLRERGSLYAIIGRETFSAALMFATALEKHTPVLFAGEPTGASPNDYGDSRKVELPNSGITVRLSTLYHQTSSAGDPRESVTPHFPVDLSFEDWMSNRDPVLDRILGMHDAPVQPRGVWAGTFSPSPWANYPIRITFSGPAHALAATLDVEGTEILNVPMEDVRLEGSRLSFVWRFRGAPIRIRGRLVEDRDGRERFLADAYLSGRLNLMLLEAP